MTSMTMQMAAVGLGAVLLVGCAGKEVTDFEAAEASGTPFTRALATEYKQTVAFEAYEMGDWNHATYFARKGMRSANGEVVEPELLENWKLPAGMVGEMSAERGRLSKVLAEGGREVDPATAAVAQARFDCWVEQQQENHQPDDIAFCRDQFLTAVSALEFKLMPPVAAADEYMVFFDWNSATLSPAAQTTLAALVDAVKAGGGKPTISVVGHTDLTGSPQYNLALSQRRAEVVQAALLNAGLTDEWVVAEGVGELNPLVPTAQGVREPSNRRAVIKVQ